MRQSELYTIIKDLDELDQYSLNYRRKLAEIAPIDIAKLLTNKHLTIQKVIDILNKFLYLLPEENEQSGEQNKCTAIYLL